MTKTRLSLSLLVTKLVDHRDTALLLGIVMVRVRKRITSMKLVDFSLFVSNYLVPS